MEARQRVKLSLTNRSIGLISSFAERQIDRCEYVPRSSKPARRQVTRTADASVRRITSSNILTRHDSVGRQPAGRLVDLVVIARGPHPIPSRTRP